ncbi:hypothetical protein MtrunA17_Chr8g0354691 [Medicago truncatula]|uniref:Transmembrane protein n=1 Tax=Medicago truncatula TaxID=3880 RepID=A0A396GP28_MEDTR|nr:hypothetical protein MtrunA17_Chr8g0354691 [Medicago truncatula]
MKLSSLPNFTSLHLSLSHFLYMPIKKIATVSSLSLSQRLCCHHHGQTNWIFLLLIFTQAIAITSILNFLLILRSFCLRRNRL